MPLAFLMRHGQAESHASSDAERRLTDYGVEYTAQIAQQLKDILSKYEFGIPSLLHSPYLRAKETAEVLEAKINTSVKGSESKIFFLNILGLESAVPDSSPHSCFESLGPHANQSFLLISHMPLVASLASLIEHGNVYQSHPFQTSEIRVYEFENWLVGAASLKFRLL